MMDVNDEFEELREGEDVRIHPLAGERATDSSWDVEPIELATEWDGAESLRIDDVVDDGWAALEQRHDDARREEAQEKARQQVEDAYEHPVGGRSERRPDIVEVDYTLPSEDLELGFDADHLNQHVEVWTHTGEPGHMKPVGGEAPGAGDRGDAIPDATGYKREVAAYDVDCLLGLGVVPETVAVDDPVHGLASLQADAPIEGRPPSEYGSVDVDRMAVIDYVLGNTDRHDHNVRTQENGRPAAIDNGFALPTSDEVPIKSNFVAERLCIALDEGLVEELRAVDSADLQALLRRDGIEEPAVAGCIERFHEVQQNGVITGEAWDGDFVDGRGCTVDRPSPAGRRP